MTPGRRTTGSWCGALVSVLVVLALVFGAAPAQSQPRQSPERPSGAECSDARQVTQARRIDLGRQPVVASVRRCARQAAEMRVRRLFLYVAELAAVRLPCCCAEQGTTDAASPRAMGDGRPADGIPRTVAR